MTKHRLIALASTTILALTILTPASALASTRTEHPMTGQSSGTLSINLLTGDFTGDTAGTSSDLGRFSSHLEGNGAVTPDNTFQGSGTTVRIVAANGDTLKGTFTLTTTPLLSTGHTATLVITITGGTGRFTNATGTLTVICEVTPGGQVGPLLTSSADCTMSGTLAY
jgi:hypothetical protein